MSLLLLQTPPIEIQVQVNVVRTKKMVRLNHCSSPAWWSAHAAWVWQIVFGTSEYFELVRFVNKTCSQGKWWGWWVGDGHGDGSGAAAELILAQCHSRSTNLISCYLLPVYGVWVSIFSKALLQFATPTPILAFPTSLEYYIVQLMCNL